MSKPFIQIGDEVREMTDAEFAQHLQDVETEAQEQFAAKAMIYAWANTKDTRYGRK
jgi:hypothetical protein